MKNKTEIINTLRILVNTAIEYVYENTNITMEQFGEKVEDLLDKQNEIFMLLCENSELETDTKSLANFALELIETKIGRIYDMEREALINDLTNGKFEFVKKQIEQIEQENIARGLIKKEVLKTEATE